MLVDQVEELEPASIGGGVELEMHRRHLVRLFGLVTTHRGVSRSGPHLCSRGTALESFLTPEAVHPLVDHPQALPLQHAMGHAAAPADVLPGDLTQTPPELDLLQIDDLAPMALGADVLAYDSGGEASDTRNRERRASTALRRRSGLRNFPQQAP